MASDVSICNTALGRVGVGVSIANREERSAEAVQCNRFYEDVRDRVLTEFPWPFATAYMTLALVEEDPNDDWGYAYRYPSDCVYARRLVTAAGRLNMSPPPFRIGQDDQGLLIYTDESDAVLEYTQRVTNEGRFSAPFASAMAWLLAAEIAKPLSRVNGERTEALQFYEREIARARALSLNEGEQAPQVDSEFIRARM